MTDKALAREVFVVCMKAHTEGRLYARIGEIERNSGDEWNRVEKMLMPELLEILSTFNGTLASAGPYSVHIIEEGIECFDAVKDADGNVLPIEKVVELLNTAHPLHANNDALAHVEKRIRHWELAADDVADNDPYQESEFRSRVKELSDIKEILSRSVPSTKPIEAVQEMAGEKERKLRQEFVRDLHHVKAILQGKE